MSQAEALLDTLTVSEPSTYASNPSSEGHIVIGSDRHITIPSELKRIAVQNDHNVEVVTFDCPRFWDNVDLMSMVIYINYRLPNGTIGAHVAKNIVRDEMRSDTIHFDWTILRDITKTKGNISFLVCAKRTNAEGEEILHWNSELNNDMYVSEGLEAEETVPEAYPDLITHMLYRITALENSRDESFDGVTVALNKNASGIHASVTYDPFRESRIEIDDASDHLLVDFTLRGETDSGGIPTPDAPTDISGTGADGLDVVIDGQYNMSVVSYRLNGAHPRSYIAKIGETATFSVSGGASYQWQQNTGSGWSDITSAIGRTPSLSIVGATFRNGYKYRCVVTDADGNTSTTNYATLYVVSDAYVGKTGRVPAFLLDSPLYSAGSAYDVLYYKDGIMKCIRRTAVVTLTASNITGRTEHSSLGDFFTTDIRCLVSDEAIPDCSHFSGIQFAYRGNNPDSFRCYIDSNGIFTLRASAADNRFTSLEAMREFVTNNKVVVVYPLETPVEVELTSGEINMLGILRTFCPHTTVYNTDTPTMDFTYVVDTMTYIDNKFAQLEALINQ